MWSGNMLVRVYAYYLPCIVKYVNEKLSIDRNKYKKYKKSDRLNDTQTHIVHTHAHDGNEQMCIKHMFWECINISPVPNYL